MRLKKNTHVGDEVTAECNEIALRVRDLDSEITIVATCTDNGTRSPDLSDEIIRLWIKIRIGRRGKALKKSSLLPRVLLVTLNLCIEARLHGYKPVQDTIP